MQTREKPALRVTKDYSLFVKSLENRPVDLAKRKSLLQSMQTHGFLPAYPLHCIRAAGGKLEIRDGQHRYAIAMKLGINVWYVILDEDVNIATINNTQRPWALANYAESYASQGKRDYAELLEFCKAYGMPIGMSAALLAGGSTDGKYKDTYVSGEFKVKTRERANLVASLFTFLRGINRVVNNNRLVQAIYACTYVPEFDPQRVRDGASRCAEKLVAYSTSDAYLSMLEDLHNFGRKQRIPIKIPAQNAMRARNPALKNVAA